MGGCARCPGSGQWGATPAAHDGANDSPAPATPGCFGDQTGSGSGAPAPCIGLPCLRGTFVRWFARPAQAGRRRPRRSCTPERRPGGGRRISCACECDPGRPRPAADLDVPVPVPVRDRSSCMHNKAETFGCKSSAALYASSLQENGMCALERPGKLRSSISCMLQPVCQGDLAG